MDPNIFPHLSFCRTQQLDQKTQHQPRLWIHLLHTRVVDVVAVWNFLFCLDRQSFVIKMRLSGVQSYLKKSPIEVTTM